MQNNTKALAKIPKMCAILVRSKLTQVTEYCAIAIFSRAYPNNEISLCKGTSPQNLNRAVLSVPYPQEYETQKCTLLCPESKHVLVFKNYP